MRLNYHLKIAIEPTCVGTILRKLGVIVVHMPVGKGGYCYVVDICNDFSGWLKAEMLMSATSKKIPKFLFNVMYHFGCILHLVTDRGAEFKGALTMLADEYKVQLQKYLLITRRQMGWSNMDMHRI